MSIVEHLEAGKIDLIGLGVYAYMVLKANDAGVVETSATTLHAMCPQVSSRTLQRKLRQLEQIGLVKASKTPGKSGSYMVLTCPTLVGELVRDTHAISDAPTTDWDNPATEAVGELDGDVCVSQPAASCPEHIDNEGQASPTQPSQRRDALKELGIEKLPDRNKDFVALVEANPPAEAEGVVEWAKRISAACDSKNVFFPRAVHARVRAAA